MTVTPATAERDPAREVAAALPVTDRPSWLLLVGLALLLGGGLLWAVFGRAPEVVTGRGMVVPATGFVDVGPEIVGTVMRVDVAPGDTVAAGAPIAAVLTADGTTVTVTTPADGQVTSVLTRPGGTTTPGVALVTLEPAEVPLSVVGFLPAGSAKRVQVGMPAQVALDSVPRSEYGMLVGTVASVSPLPATSARVATLVGGDPALAEYYLADGPVLEVRVALTPDAASTSGYAWTVGEGPPIEVSAGTLADVAVVVEEATPLSRVLG